MSLLYESMTKIQWGGWTIRVWRQYDKGYHGDNRDIRGVLEKVGPEYTTDEVFQDLLALDRVNAVEMLDCAGNGTVVYKDWP